MPWANAEAKRAYGRRWYLANRDRKRAQDKIRQSTTEFREAHRARSLAYYRNNKVRILEEKKLYHVRTREKSIARMRARVVSPEERAKANQHAKERKLWQKPEVVQRRAEYYKQHREDAKEREQRRRERNPEQYKAARSANWHKRRAIVLGLGEHFTQREWRALKAYHGNRCLRCHRVEPGIKLTADHVIPLSKQGNNTIANIQPLCGECNCWKGTKVADFRTHSSGPLNTSRRASANQPGPAEELNMILPFTAASASL